MFLATGRPKVVQANKDNIEFYNRIYEEAKSEASKAVALAQEEYIRTH